MRGREIDFPEAAAKKRSRRMYRWRRRARGGEKMKEKRIQRRVKDNAREDTKRRWSGKKEWENT